MQRLLILEAGDAERSPVLPASPALARALAEQGRWEVSCHELPDTPRVVTRAVRLVRRLIGSLEPAASRPLVLLRGSIAEQRRVMWALVTAGLKARVSVVVHASSAEIPFQPGTSDLFRFADLIVTESAFGARAVNRVCAERSAPLRRPPVIIPPLVDVASDDRRPPSDGDALRQRLWRLPPESLVIGCCLGDIGDRRGFLAIQIFRLFVQGLYWACTRCARVTVFAIDDALVAISTSRCASCLGTEGTRGRPHPEARLVLIDGVLASRGRSFVPNQWTFAAFRRACGLEGQVSIGGDEGHRLITSRELLLEALTAMDIHFLPHQLADVEPAVLAGCALGVPTITTRYGAAVDIIGPHARLVQPCALSYASEGHLNALIDGGVAVQALCSLAESPADRAALSLAAGDAMRRQRRAVAVGQWRAEIDRLSERL
ncbi:MAG: hypothetical protein KA371_01320 [Acidobacteria bacterium]|nr:hypothetical protein [Acidobacteriota bacterium]